MSALSDDDAIPVTARLVSCASPGSFRIKLPDTAATAAAQPLPITADAAAAAVNPHGRQAVHALLHQHAAKLEEVKRAVATHPRYDARLHDDLWMLRFLLSHKGATAAAVQAARATIDYRSLHGLDAPDLVCGGVEALEIDCLKKLYSNLRDWSAITYYLPDRDRGLILIAQPSLIDFHRAASTVTSDEQAAAHRLLTEWTFRLCDRITRRTGYLTKVVRLVDLQGLRLGSLNREFQRRDAKNSKALEDHYPQLLEAVLICHAPNWMTAFWAGLRTIMPARIVEKVDFLKPHKNVRDRNRLLQHMTMEHLPTAFGGPCPTWPLPSQRFRVDHLDV